MSLSSRVCYYNNIVIFVREKAKILREKREEKILKWQSLQLDFKAWIGNSSDEDEGVKQVKKAIDKLESNIELAKQHENAVSMKYSAKICLFAWFAEVKV